VSTLHWYGAAFVGRHGFGGRCGCYYAQVDQAMPSCSIGWSTSPSLASDGRESAIWRRAANRIGPIPITWHYTKVMPWS
jgi:hypothetical protein